MNWTGVLPALTTAFDEDYNVDHAFVARHAQWLVKNGCTGIICLGSLGEAPTLRFEEKIDILTTVVAALDGKAPVVAAISALSTAEAVELAQAAQTVGCSGLMILPPYVYKGDWRENKAHVAAILQATPLAGMLYNNPVSLYVAFRGVRIDSRFGGKAVRPLGQPWLSLSRRSAAAPLFLRRGESKAF
jgi:4-hydroxy-tetrahydrodipicolinate synthase